MPAAVIHIDDADPRFLAARDAERRLFDHFGITYVEHFLEVKEYGARLRVLEAGSGSGDPVLVVPGGSGEAAMFAPLMAELPGVRFIAVNRPGGGGSDGVDHRQVDVRQLAVTVLSQVLDACGLPSVPVVANSMGGLWSFWLALDRPERVSSMVQLGCPALLLNTGAPFFMRLMSVPPLAGPIASLMQPSSVEKTLPGLKPMGTPQAVIDRAPRVVAEAFYHLFNLPTYRATWVSLIQAVLTIAGAKGKYSLDEGQLRKVQQPVQFLWGANDPFGGLDVARRAAVLMPNARLHEMDCGHLPFLDDPSTCGRVIREFWSAM